MVFFRIRLQSLLMVALCSIVTPRMRSVHGTAVRVGGSFGWQYNGTGFDYQAWASSCSFRVGDVLDFGVQTPENRVSVIPLQSAVCNASGAFPLIVPSENTRLEYRFPYPGQFGFIGTYTDYCLTKGMRFSLNIANGPTEQPPEALLPAPQSPATSGPDAPSSVQLPPTLRPDGAPSSGRPSTTSHSKRLGYIVGLTTGLVGVLVLTAAVAIMTRRCYRQRLRKASSGTEGLTLPYTKAAHSPSAHNIDIESQGVEWPWMPQRFSYEELNGATDSFNSSLVIGEGGFGTVYKGYISDAPGAPVAVKRLSQSARQGAREFLAELTIISQLRHRNLLQLVGWCDEKEELIIVYEFMPNGDLDELIFGSNASACLSWKCRHNIFCGVAAALVYLHEEWEQRVVHRDVKTSNVMLDAHFNARLGDFGLARLSAHSQAPRTTLMAGTIGYLAPEFQLTGRATDKTDVYAFGVVILEVVYARRPLTSDCILVDLAWDLHKEDKLLDAIDPKLAERSASDEEEMKRTLQVGVLCCHPDPTSRPTMRHVLNILTGEAPLPKMPRSRPVAIFAEDDNSER